MLRVGVPPTDGNVGDDRPASGSGAQKRNRPGINRTECNVRPFSGTLSRSDASLVCTRNEVTPGQFLKANAANVVGAWTRFP